MIYFKCFLVFVGTKEITKLVIKLKLQNTHVFSLYVRLEPRHRAKREPLVNSGCLGIIKIGIKMFEVLHTILCELKNFAFSGSTLSK